MWGSVCIAKDLDRAKIHFLAWEGKFFQKLSPEFNPVKVFSGDFMQLARYAWQCSSKNIGLFLYIIMYKPIPNCGF